MEHVGTALELVPARRVGIRVGIRPARANTYLERGPVEVRAYLGRIAAGLEDGDALIGIGRHEALGDQPAGIGDLGGPSRAGHALAGKPGFDVIKQPHGPRSVQTTATDGSPAGTPPPHSAAGWPFPGTWPGPRDGGPRPVRGPRLHSRHPQGWSGRPDCPNPQGHRTP